MIFASSRWWLLTCSTVDGDVEIAKCPGQVSIELCTGRQEEGQGQPHGVPTLGQSFGAMAQNTGHVGLLKGHTWRGNHTDLTSPAADEALRRWGTRSTPRKGAAPPHDAGSTHRREGTGRGKRKDQRRRGAQRDKKTKNTKINTRRGSREKRQTHNRKTNNNTKHAIPDNCQPCVSRPGRGSSKIHVIKWPGILWHSGPLALAKNHHYVVIALPDTAKPGEVHFDSPPSILVSWLATFLVQILAFRFPIYFDVQY